MFINNTDMQRLKIITGFNQLSTPNNVSINLVSKVLFQQSSGILNLVLNYSVKTNQSVVLDYAVITNQSLVHCILLEVHIYVSKLPTMFDQLILMQTYNSTITYKLLFWTAFKYFTKCICKSLLSAYLDLIIQVNRFSFLLNNLCYIMTKTFVIATP